MKKIFSYLIILLAPLVLLTACGDEKPALEDRIGETENQYPGSYEGVLEKLDSINVYQQGTHQLITEDDGVIILESSSINLSRYIDEEVLLKGMMEEGIGNAEPVFNVTEIAYVDEFRTFEYEHYSNQSYGFSFEYPSTLFLDEDQQGELSISLEEDELIRISVFSNKSNLDSFVASQETDSEGVEVTIGAQKSYRFISDTLRFYIQNPPKNKIYLVEYLPSLDSSDADLHRHTFYDLLDSFELIYMNQAQGDKCGGVEQLECAEDYICQLESGDEDAEGICLPVGGTQDQTNCPFIATPSGCSDYRISEYSQSGCPARYECVEGGIDKIRDLDEMDDDQEDQLDENEDDSIEDDGEDIEDEESSSDEFADDEEKEYAVPDVSEVIAEYVNKRAEFTMLMPKNWYYASFGVVDGSWKIGFADVALEELEGAIITLSLESSSKGQASKKIEDTYYNFYGPDDLKEVMEEMAESIETF